MSSYKPLYFPPKLALRALASVVLLGLLSACNPQTPATPQTPDRSLGQKSLGLPLEQPSSSAPAAPAEAPQPAAQNSADHPAPVLPAVRQASVSAAPASPAAAVQPQAQARTVVWDELIPAQWDPLAGLGDVAAVMALPDSDPRAQRLYEQMRNHWDRAPTVAALHGQQVQITGFVVPLESDAQGLRELLLVPYFGACIHTPPPPANQIVHVRLAEGMPSVAAMDVVTVRGALHTQQQRSAAGASGYSLTAQTLEKFEPQ